MSASKTRPHLHQVFLSDEERAKLLAIQHRIEAKAGVPVTLASVLRLLIDTYSQEQP